MSRHKHANIIHAWCEGAEVQILDNDGRWGPCPIPLWTESKAYRIKPKEPEWWESIPEHGVLCWWEGTVVTVVGKNNKYTRKGTNGSIFWIDGDVVPLTNEEIERFKR